MESGFLEMHDRFDKIFSKLDKLEFTIQKVAVYQMYKENQDRIQKVMFAYQHLFQYPGERSLQEFADICRVQNPLLSLEWIYRRSVESDGPFGLELFSTILKDTEYNRTRLSQFYTVITKDMMTATFLREACLGVQEPNNNEVIWRNRRVTGEQFFLLASATGNWDS